MSIIEKASIEMTKVTPKKSKSTAHCLSTFVARPILGTSAEANFRHLKSCMQTQRERYVLHVRNEPERTREMRSNGPDNEQARERSREAGVAALAPLAAVTDVRGGCDG